MRLTVLLWSLEDSPANQSTLRFLRWWDGAGLGPRALVVSVREGWLRSHFAAVAELHVANDGALDRPSGVLRRARLHRAAGVLRTREVARWFAPGTDVVYLAEPAAARLLPWIPDSTPVVCCHRRPPADELGRVGEEDRLRLEQRVTHWVGPRSVAAPSDPPSDALRFELPDFCPESMLGPTSPGPTVGAAKTTARSLLGVDPDTPLVVSGGRIDWWDIPDAFVQLAWLVSGRARGPEPHFVWLAGGSTDRMLWPLRHDLDHAGLTHRVHVLGVDAPAYDWMVAAQVCVATGRAGQAHRDAPPWPVIDLPLVTFGGPGLETPRDRPDRIEVPYLDTTAMADVVVELLGDDDRRTILGHHPDGDLAGWDVRAGGPALVEFWSQTPG